MTGLRDDKQHAGKKHDMTTNKTRRTIGAEGKFWKKNALWRCVMSLHWALVVDQTGRWDETSASLLYSTVRLMSWMRQALCYFVATCLWYCFVWCYRLIFTQKYVIKWPKIKYIKLHTSPMPMEFLKPMIDVRNKSICKLLRISGTLRHFFDSGYLFVLQ